MQPQTEYNELSPPQVQKAQILQSSAHFSNSNLRSALRPHYPMFEALMRRYEDIHGENKPATYSATATMGNIYVALVHDDKKEGSVDIAHLTSDTADARKLFRGSSQPHFEVFFSQTCRVIAGSVTPEQAKLAIEVVNAFKYWLLNDTSEIK